MDSRSAGVAETKRERASLLVLALAALLLRGGERVALLGHGRRPARGIAALGGIAETLLGGEQSRSGLPARLGVQGVPQEGKVGRRSSEQVQQQAAGPPLLRRGAEQETCQELRGEPEDQEILAVGQSGFVQGKQHALHPTADERPRPGS